MDETNFDWDDLRLFLAVARHGGLAPAAAATGKSPPTLGRRMLALEKTAGTELFRRLPRGYELTGQGRALLERVTDLEARIISLARQAGGAAPTLIKISAGTWMTQVLCAHVMALKGDDHVALRFIAADHRLDIARREAIIGVRNERPEQIGLACRRVGRVRFAGYARSATVETWARVVGTTPSARWLAAELGDAPSIEVTSPRNALDLALAGAARAVLPTFIGDAQDGLVAVTRPIVELEHEQWLVTHHEERFVPEVRRTIDRVTEVLRVLPR